MSDFRLSETQPSVNPSTSQNYLLQITNRITTRQILATMARNSSSRRMVTVLNESANPPEVYQPPTATTSHLPANFVPINAESSPVSAPSAQSDRSSRATNTEMFMNAAQFLTMHPYGGAISRRVNPGEGRRGEGGRIRNGRVMPDQYDGDLTRPSSSNSSIEESSIGTSAFDVVNLSTPGSIRYDPIYATMLNLQANDISLSPVPSTLELLVAPRPTRRRPELIQSVAGGTIGVNENWHLANSDHPSFESNDGVNQVASANQPTGPGSPTNEPGSLNRRLSGADSSFNVYQQYLAQSRNPTLRVETSRSSDFRRNLPPIHVEPTPDPFETYPTEQSSLRFNPYPASRVELNQLPRGPAATRNVTRIVRFQELLSSSNAFTANRFSRRTDAQNSETNESLKNQQRDSPAEKRLRQEAEYFRKHAPTCCTVAPKEEDIFEWSGLIEGPWNSPYEGGFFFFELHFPTDYPQKMPQIVILTRIWHPWVSSTGMVNFPTEVMDKVVAEGLSGLFKALLEMLQDVPPDSDKPSMTTAMMGQFALDGSNPKDERNSRKRRQETARVWTERYAT